jgi:hypothetical protein
MSDAERLEQFRLVMLQVVTFLREMRRDTAKLQCAVVALRQLLADVDSQAAARFPLVLKEVEQSQKNRMSVDDARVDQAIEELIASFDPDGLNDN